MAEIVLENVNFIYNKGTPYEIHALRDVNLTFGGGITGIIGHTGSGKSTLVRMLNALVRPTSGRVIFDGEELWEKSERVRAARFRAGLVMQYPEYQLFAATVYKDIAFGPSNMGLSEDEIKRRVLYGAEFAKVPLDIMERSPFDLSGGQKRRVALAGVIAMKPEFLVLDEPAAGLDPGSRRFILNGIRDYCKTSGTSAVIVSHSMEDMALFCDRIIVMADGRVKMDGSCAEVFSRSLDLIGLGLDVPQITHIASALRERGVDIGLDVYTVGYAVDRICELADNKAPESKGETQS